MTTIQKERESQEIKELKSTVEELNAELKKLKFSNIDKETTIEELQEQVQELTQQLEANQNELHSTKLELQSTQQLLHVAEEKLAKAPSPSAMQFTTFTSSSSQPHIVSTGNNMDAVSSQTVQTQEVDRVLLDKWRNWNVDMTTWRSIGSGPIVEF